MNCCNAYGQCTRGHNCPAHIDTQHASTAACCHGNCHQGRDYPGRELPTPTQPLDGGRPPSLWPFVLAVLAVWAMAVLVAPFLAGLMSHMP